MRDWFMLGMLLTASMWTFLLFDSLADRRDRLSPLFPIDDGVLRGGDRGEPETENWSILLESCNWL